MPAHAMDCLLPFVYGRTARVFPTETLVITSCPVWLVVTVIGLGDGMRAVDGSTSREVA